MRVPKLVQIHFLTSYPSALLNRDRNGQAKRITFGNAVRLRISSQCLKRHWRTYDGPFSIHSVPGATQAVRSRDTVERMIIDPLRSSGSHEDQVLDALTEAFNKGIYGRNADDKLHRQPLMLGLPEVEYFRHHATSIADQHPDDDKEAVKAAEAFFSSTKGHGKNIRALAEATMLPEGLATVLFGRMVTSDTLATIEGAVHVAHAITVHQQETEIDYFSVVDDLHQRGEGGGAAHLDESELTSGLYYGYVVVDLPTLVSNMEGCQPEDWLDADRTLAAQVVQNLIHTVAVVSPGAKLGSTAPYARAEFVMVETGEHQPRTLMNAYRRVVRSAQADDAIKTLTNYLERLDANYGVNEDRAYMSMEDLDDGVPAATPMTLPELAAWAGNAILSANSEE